jgi:hypothetical protein
MMPFWLSTTDWDILGNPPFISIEVAKLLRGKTLGGFQSWLVLMEAVDSFKCFLASKMAVNVW